MHYLLTLYRIFFFSQDSHKYGNVANMDESIPPVFAENAGADIPALPSTVAAFKLYGRGVQF